MRGADTEDRDLTPESSGLYAAATGFQATSQDDFDNMARQFPMYDAFYTIARQQVAAAPKTPRVLFVCLHGAAKSVVAAAHFRKLAAQRGPRGGGGGGRHRAGCGTGAARGEGACGRRA